MKTLFIIIFSLVISVGFGQNSLLTQIKSSTQSSYPRYGVDVNGVYYFVADMATSSHYGFWKSDGTPGGTTKIITDTGIRPQPDYRNKECIIPFGNKALLIASDYHGNSNFELWITDGTSSGTFLLKDINPNTKSDIKNIKVVSIGGTLKAFFSANNGTQGEELWVTDGTANGTKMVKDINADSGSSSPSNFEQFKNKVLFAATDSKNGRELWITDGTEAGTALIRDINVGSGSSFINTSKIVVNDYLAYVNLNDGTTSNSTVLVRTEGSYNTTATYGNSFLNPGNLTVFNGKLYFTTNPTSGGNLYYLENNSVPINVINNFTYYSWIAENLAVSKNKLFLLAGVPDGQMDLAVIDSTSDLEISQVIHFNATNTDPFPVNPEKRKLIPIPNGNIYFFTAHESQRTKLWISDGSPEGTRSIQNLWYGNYSYVRTFNNKLFFITDHTEGQYKCYVTDNGSDASLVKDLTPALNIDNPYPLIQSGNWLYFSAYNPATGYELYKSNGESNTFVSDIDASYTSNSYNFTKSVGNSKGLFFIADDGKNGLELWKTNGKQAGTGLFANFTPYPMPEATIATEQAFDYYNYSSKFWDLFESNDLIYIMTYNDVWVTDGVNKPIKLYENTRLSFIPSYNKFASINGLVYFSVVNELWQTDGSVEGTVYVGSADNTLLKDRRPIKGLSALNNKLYFMGYSATNGEELFKYDGANITLVKDATPGVNYYYGNAEVQVVGSSIFYTKYSASDGCMLYISDGTSANTNLLHTFGITGGCPYYLTNFKDSLLVFNAYDSTNGSELWKSDGTEEGTHLVKDIYPGTNSGGPMNFSNKDKYAVFGDAVYFAAMAPDNSIQLYKSDLTAEGTIPLSTINDRYIYASKGGVYFPNGGADSEPTKIESIIASKRILANIVPNGHSMPQHFVGHNGLIFMKTALPNGAHQIHVFKDCRNNHILTGGVNDAYDQAYDSIKSSNIITTDQSYRLIAGKSIELTPGFVADSKSIFEAKIESCTYDTTAN